MTTRYSAFFFVFCWAFDCSSSNFGPSNFPCSFCTYTSFTADFATYYPGNKYFEVYSPVISTLYGQVFWTVMDPVPLPPAIVAQFKDKTMAITGYGGGHGRLWTGGGGGRVGGGWWMVDGGW